jgi:hypothetical protein
MRWLVTVGRGWAPPGRTEHGPGRRKTPHCRRGRRGNARVAPSARESPRAPRPGIRARGDPPRPGGQARSTLDESGIAIRLSEARRADVKLGVPGRAAASTKDSAPARNRWAGEHLAVRHALKREERRAASQAALGQQARRAARRRSTGVRRRAAQKAVRTKRAAGRRAGVRKAARTCAARRSWVRRTWSPRIPSSGGETRQSLKGYVSGTPSSSCVAIGSTARVSSNQMYSSNWSGRTAWK